MHHLDSFGMFTFTVKLKFLSFRKTGLLSMFLSMNSENESVLMEVRLLLLHHQNDPFQFVSVRLGLTDFVDKIPDI